MHTISWGQGLQAQVHHRMCMELTSCNCNYSLTCFRSNHKCWRLDDLKRVLLSGRQT